MTPLEEAAPQAMNPRHLTKQLREYGMTTYSRLTVKCSRMTDKKSAELAAILLPDKGSSSS